ncbi:MAG: bifunctional riboflavin kinase/FAD synthetase [Candidatus Nanopelagicales bacterium]
MHVWLGCDQVPVGTGPASVTIGAFDGVHRGHRHLLDRVVTDAGHGLLPVALTFDPHPMAVIRPDLAPPLLTSMPRRLELFEQVGIGAALVVRFTETLAAESAEHFATRVLAQTLGAAHVVVGRNFRFGHRASGDVVLLRELGRELGFQVTVVDLEPLEGPDEALSSTAIRRLIAAGDVSGAALGLDRPHRVSGSIVHGDHRGRLLGYPTANLAVPVGMAIPADGVYAARMRTTAQPGHWWPSAVSIGTNPTFDGQDRRVEAYVIDAPAEFDLYGQVADLDFVTRIRGMARFDSVEELRAQMSQDVALAREVLASAASPASPASEAAEVSTGSKVSTGSQVDTTSEVSTAG